jgi:hypothetical protein
MLFWALRQTAASAETTTPFYQEISDRYGGEGVIVLQVNEVLDINNPAAAPIAASLLTLFEDVLVVAMPLEQISIAFVSHDLPFDQSVLAEILPPASEDQFVVLDMTAVQSIAAAH